MRQLTFFMSPITYQTITMSREQRIYQVTIAGGIANAVLLVTKFVAGILGHSAAMIADAVHSLTDFVTDIIVIIFIKLSNKPADDDHNYGHGKYETLATSLIALALMIVGCMLAWNGIKDIIYVVKGGTLPSPGIIALLAALLSIVTKEVIFRVTKKVADEVSSQALEANAWHHRSDALSSVGTAVGIAGAIILGETWAVLDPIAAVVVSIFITTAAFRLIRQAAGELLEKSLSQEIEREIEKIVYKDQMVENVHNLYTRRIGNNIAIEMHLRLPGNITLEEAHRHATYIEQRLKTQYGEHTHVMLHIEPQKNKGIQHESRVKNCE